MEDGVFGHAIVELISVGDDAADTLVQVLDETVSDSDLGVLGFCLRVAKSVIVEREYIDKDYSNVYSGYYSKKFSQLVKRTVRLHFFDVNLSIEDIERPAGMGGFVGRLGELVEETPDAIVAEGTSCGYIGYVVLRPTEYSRIGRCLLDPRKLDLAIGVIRGCLTAYSAEILGHELKVMAFPHQSQDAEVHTCAHTAVWSLGRYLSQRYRTYKEHYPFDVALLNNDLHHGRRYPGHGLFMGQVAAMIGQFGAAAEMYEEHLVGQLLEHGGPEWAAIQPLSGAAKSIAKRRNRDNLLHLLHVYLESGLPPIVGVPDHAVVAVGLRYATRPVVRRPGRVIPSTDFVAGVVVNDDNCPPYQLAGRGRRTGSVLGYSCDDIDSLVVPLPEKLFLSAEAAEIVITDLLESCGEPSLGKDDRGADRFVRRLHCTSSKNYRTFRSEHRDSISEEVLRHPLPHFIWIAELSLLRTWGDPSDRALVEIAVDATAGQRDEWPFLWVRYPDFLMLNLYKIYGYRCRETPLVTLGVRDEEALTFIPFTGNLRSFV